MTQRLLTDLVHRCPKLDDQDLQQTQHPDQFFLLHSPSRVMEATRPISNNRGYMVAREASMEASVELQGTKRVLKAIKIANTAATKLLAATTTATRSNAADGAAITDISMATFVPTRPW